MKKLRMIVTGVVVLAIVGSAFAFKAKGGHFCVLDPAASGSVCTTYLITQDQKTTTIGGTQWKYYPSWDGDKTTCTTTANSGLCTVTTRLIND